MGGKARILKARNHAVKKLAALAKPESMYPEIAAFKPTRPPRDGILHNPQQNTVTLVTVPTSPVSCWLIQQVEIVFPNSSFRALLLWRRRRRRRWWWLAVTMMVMVGWRRWWWRRWPILRNWRCRGHHADTQQQACDEQNDFFHIQMNTIHSFRMMSKRIHPHSFRDGGGSALPGKSVGNRNRATYIETRVDISRDHCTTLSRTQ